ncbi:MAG: hypothetical protein WA705_26275, partial [Candidatus Ozemobacteraceae bacterium]
MLASKTQLPAAMWLVEWGDILPVFARPQEPRTTPTQPAGSAATCSADPVRGEVGGRQAGRSLPNAALGGKRTGASGMTRCARDGTAWQAACPSPGVVAPPSLPPFN